MFTYRPWNCVVPLMTHAAAPTLLATSDASTASWAINHRQASKMQGASEIEAGEHPIECLRAVRDEIVRLDHHRAGDLQLVLGHAAKLVVQALAVNEELRQKSRSAFTLHDGPLRIVHPAELRWELQLLDARAGFL